MAGIGREVADAYIEVHGDLSKFRNDLRKASTIGAAAGRQAAGTFTEEWGKRSEQGILSKWNSIIDAMHSGRRVDWERALGKFDANSLDEARDKVNAFLRDMTVAGNMTRSQMQDAENQVRNVVRQIDRATNRFRPLQKIMDKVRLSWSRMDSTVRLVIGLIASSAGHIATLGSGIAGSFTAVVSSLGSAAASIIPLVGSMAALGVGAALAVSSFDEIKAAIPRVQQSLDAIAQTWQTQAARFGEAWGPAIDNLLAAFSQKLAAYDFGTPLGEAFAGITDAFTNVINGPAFSGFMQAMTTDLPAAVQGLGTGFAGAFSGLLSMLDAAAPVAKMLGEDFARWGTAIADSLQAANKSGELTKVFEQARESLLAVLDLVGSVGSALGTLFGIGADSGNRMLASLTGIVDTFNAWMNTDAGRNKMTAWFLNAETIMASLGPVLASTGQMLADLVTPKTIEQFTNLMDIVSQIMPILGELLGVVSALGIFNILGEAILTVGEALAPLMGPLKEMATVLGSSLQGAVAALAPLFAAVGAALAPVIEAVNSIVAVIGPMLIPAFNQISEALTPVIAVIGQVVEVIVGILAPILTGVLMVAIQSVVGVIQGLSDVFMGIVGVITGVVQVIVALFTGDFASIGPLLAGIWDSIVQIFFGALNAIWNFINLMIIGRVVGGIKAAMGAVKGTFTTVWNAVSSFVSGAVRNIQSVITTVFNSVKSFISTVWNGIKSFFTTIWSGIKSIFTSAVNGVKSFISSGFNAVKNTITSIWNAIVGWVRGIPGRILGAIQGLAQLAGKVGGFVSRAKDAIVSRFNDAVSWVRGIPGRILGALGSLGQLLWNAGSSIINGLLNGLKSAWGAVTDFVGGIASWIANNKGPLPYDRRLLIPAGQAIMQGLGGGLESQLPALKNTLNTVTDTIANGLDTSAMQTAARDMASAVTGEFSHSKMRLAGLDAAAGLTDGMRANRHKIKSAVAGMTPVLTASSERLGRIGSPESPGPVAVGGGGRTTIIEEGAIAVHTPTKNPELVASKVVDEFAGFSGI